MLSVAFGQAKHYTDNLIKSRFAGKFFRDENPALLLKGRGGSNRRIFEQKLSIDFKKPFNFLANLSAEARAEGEVATKNEVNRLWWCLLDKVRTYYEQNPDTN